MVFTPSVRLRCVGGDAETEVAGGAVRGVGGACGDAVADAVGVVTQEGAAADDAGGAGERSGGVGARGDAVPGGVEPVGGPLPHVAHHVVQAVAIGREGVDRAGAVVAGFAGVVGGEGAAP